MRNAIIPEFHISIQNTTSHFSSILLQNILQRSLLVKEDIEVVTDDMPVMARRATDQDRSLVIAMLGHPVRRPLATRFAGEGDLICGFLFTAQPVLLLVLCIVLRVCCAIGERV